MTQEWSGFWTTSGVGDGLDTGYSQTRVATINHAVYAGGSANKGVQPDYGDALLVEAGVEKVTMGTGMASVFGYLYVNPEDIDFTVTSPVSSTRTDRLVLRADWATQTVRAIILTGEEGGEAPSLTQMANTRWEIPIARYSVTVSGTITVTDEREYIGAQEGTPETSEATPLTLVLRDANARAKIGTPSAASDIARKDTVDNHAALTGASGAHGATSAATAGQIIARDANGRAKVAAPSASDDIARLDTFGDLSKVKTASATTTNKRPAVWTNDLLCSGVVTERAGYLLVFCTVRWNGNGRDGAELSLRIYVDGDTYGLQFDDHANNGVDTTTTCMWCQSEPAGTHSVQLQIHGSSADVVVRNRTLTVVPFPTGA